MLKKLVLGTAALAAFSTVGVTGTAMAGADHTAICGNQAIGDILVPIIPLTPVTSADREPVNCGVQVHNG
ncbi:hypothetical protein AB0K60_34120 [Thermopolyspora sp. NPDC052614]|uniref:hypothetical protein n=1 Tax=Thermopolyspora sp. NPDC052614 TaxID=3155682 RepID=UPI003413BBE0